MLELTKDIFFKVFNRGSEHFQLPLLHVGARPVCGHWEVSDFIFCIQDFRVRAPEQHEARVQDVNMLWQELPMRDLLLLSNLRSNINT